MACTDEYEKNWLPRVGRCLLCNGKHSVKRCAEQVLRDFQTAVDEVVIPKSIGDILDKVLVATRIPYTSVHGGPINELLLDCMEQQAAFCIDESTRLVYGCRNAEVLRIYKLLADLISRTGRVNLTEELRDTVADPFLRGRIKAFFPTLTSLYVVQGDYVYPKNKFNIYNGSDLDQYLTRRLPLSGINVLELYHCYPGIQEDLIRTTACIKLQAAGSLSTILFPSCK